MSLTSSEAATYNHSEIDGTMPAQNKFGLMVKVVWVVLELTGLETCASGWFRAVEGSWN
jgi:hypothetical protein